MGKSRNPPRKVIPSSQEAYDVFIEKLSISQDKRSRFVTVAVEHYSPTIAKQWVDWLIKDINDSIMRSDVDAAERAIEYLNEANCEYVSGRVKECIFQPDN